MAGEGDRLCRGDGDGRVLEGDRKGTRPDGERRDGEERGTWHNGEGQMKGMNSVQRGGGHIVGGAGDD